MENSAPGFGGDISVITGFDASRDALIGIGITTMKETPGIGTQVSDPSFTTQFRGVSLPVALSSGRGEHRRHFRRDHFLDRSSRCRSQSNGRL